MYRIWKLFQALLLTGKTAFVQCEGYCQAWYKQKCRTKQEYEQLMHKAAENTIKNGLKLLKNKLKSSSPQNFESFSFFLAP